MLRRSQAVRESVPSAYNKLLTGSMSRKMPPSALRLLHSRVMKRHYPHQEAEGIGSMVVTRVNGEMHVIDEAGVLANASAPLVGRIIRSSTITSDPIATFLTILATLAFVATYGIIFDWIYRGYCLQWDGSYITDDDDEDEDEEGEEDD